MKSTYLEVTYLKGEILAAYLYMPNHKGKASTKTREYKPGLLADVDQDNQLIGIDIAIPKSITSAEINQILADFGCSPLDARELTPLAAA